MQQRSLSSFSRSLPRIVSAGCLVSLFGCDLNPEPASYSYLCGDERPAIDMDAPVGQGLRCGEPGYDPNPNPPEFMARWLPPEPFVHDGRGGWPPADPTDPACILKASRVTPPDGQVLHEPLLKTNEEAIPVLDTARIQNALNNCLMVKLTVDENGNNAFLSGRIQIDGGTPTTRPVTGKTLWIDRGVTLFQSRNADLFQKTGNCGALGVNDSSACMEFIDVKGDNPALIGDGIIDGQGGEPLVGKDYSWWQASYALRAVNGSIGQPTMIYTEKFTKGFLLYRLTLHNSSKFHVKLTSSPVAGQSPQHCPEPWGAGFIVWGVTLETPSKWFNSAGYQLTPSWARNTDGIDPGTTDVAYCGVIACSTVTTGDDQIAIKGGHWVENLLIAHMAFGTGHGMSIGSETYGTHLAPDGVMHRGVQNVYVYDMTIDADSRMVGHEAHAHDFNGIRIKSDESRGGLVDNINYENVCMRDSVNSILISTAYNPLFAGMSYPDFRRLNFKNVRGVTCMGLTPGVATLEGYNATLRPDISMDNVILDNINPELSVAAEFAKIRLGPGNVNFRPRGRGVEVDDQRNGESTPFQCKFPKLPAPQPPPGWLH
jgi:polygalacturonase